MKKFKFQFEAVEKIRKIRQDEAMRFLADAQKNSKTLKIKKHSSYKKLKSLGAEGVPSFQTLNRRSSFKSKTSTSMV